MTSHHERNRVSRALRLLRLNVKALEQAFSDLFDDHILWQESYGRVPSTLREGSMQKHVFACLREFIRTVEGPPDQSIAALTEANHTRNISITETLFDGVADILGRMLGHSMMPPGIKSRIEAVLNSIDAIIVTNTD